MLQLLIVVRRALALALRGHREVVLENLALRQQLMAMKRANGRPRVQAPDRLFWMALCRIWTNWRTALVLVRPDTVVGWHRTWLRRRWTRRSRPRPNGRPPVTREIRALVSEMATANPLWGAPRIHGELRTLGVDVSERTMSRLLTRVPRPPSQTWRTFLTKSPGVGGVGGLLHRADAHRTSALRRRRALPPSTAHPPTEHHGTSDRRVGGATGGRGFSGRQGAALASPGPRPDLRRGLQRRVAGMGVAEVLSAPGSPWQNPY